MNIRDIPPTKQEGLPIVPKTFPLTFEAGYDLAIRKAANLCSKYSKKLIEDNQDGWRIAEALKQEIMAMIK